VTLIDKIPPEFEKIVDFAVEDYLYGSIFVPERLIAACYVDNAKTPVPQRDFGVAVVSVRVGSSVSEAIAHTPYERPVQGSVVLSHVTCYAAHANNLTRLALLADRPSMLGISDPPSPFVPRLQKATLRRFLEQPRFSCGAQGWAAESIDDFAQKALINPDSSGEPILPNARFPEL